MGQKRSIRRARRTPTGRPRRTIAGSTVALLLLSGAAVVIGAFAPSAGATTTNLVRDPSFRHVRTTWTVSRHTHVWTTSYGHAGHRSLGVRNLSSYARTIRVNDRRDTVGRTVAGTTYIATAWVRIAQKRVTAGIRERAWRGSYVRGTPAVRAVPLRDHRWHLVRVAYRATASGNTVDLNLFAYKLPPRATFYISQVALIARRPPVTAPPTTPPVSPPPGSGNLVFDDEFNGASVDTSKWRVRNNSWAANELSIDTSRPSNVFVSNGVLTLRAQREQYTVGSTTRSYTSGYLDTIGLSGHEYGRWEMRAKLPSAQGLWPAFWLRGDHTTGEIDILEAIGGLPQMTVQTVFPNTNDGSVKKSHVDNFAAGDSISAWHVYGFTWTPTSMTWDIDGVTAFRLTSTDASWVSSSFQDTMNIRLNLQVGGTMPNYFSQPVDGASPLPGDYQVDYVRVYSQ